MRKKLFVKWLFVFSVLSLWTFFVISGSLGNSFQLVDAKDFNVPFYLQNSEGFYPLGSKEIVDILFNKEFNIEKSQNIVPTETCSVRASTDSLSVNENIFKNNKLNFYIPKKGANEGSGSITGQIGRSRINVEFNIIEVLQATNDQVSILAKGQVKTGFSKINSDNIIINLNKSTNYLSFVVYSEYGNVLLNSDSFYVDFIKGCSMEEKTVYVIVDNGNLEKRRSIQEVRELLNQHPEFIEYYEGLSDLYKQFWWMTIPDFIVS